MRSAIASLGCLGALSVLWPAGSAPAAPRPCNARVDRGVLPVWARGGFSEQKPRAPHVLGRSGAIVAILFADPLFAPPSPKRNNKILWVSRLPVNASALRIDAQRMKGGRVLGRPVTRTLPGGPGPSYVNLPAPGCWRLNLHWSGHRDSVDLRYAPRPKA